MRDANCKPSCGHHEAGVGIARVGRGYGKMVRGEERNVNIISYALIKEL